MNREEEELDLILQLIYFSQDEVKKEIIIESLEKKEKNINEKEKILQPQYDKVNKKLKCAICRRKTGLDYFTCKCSELIFCANHKYPFSHNCSVEYKKEYQNYLQSVNPKVIKDKLERI